MLFFHLQKWSEHQRFKIVGLEVLAEDYTENGQKFPRMKLRTGFYMEDAEICLRSQYNLKQWPVFELLLTMLLSSEKSATLSK